ncbi:MAG TPA: tyrosine-type recombinase/integrase [Gaiellaceae bacterium]
MQNKSKARRPRGTGCLFLRRDAAGRETWYAKYFAGGRQVKRALGLRRQPGSGLGLTRAQAEAELRRLLQTVSSAPPLRERVDLAEAGARYLERLALLGRRPSTLADYESILRVHLVPFFGGRSLEGIGPEQVEAYVGLKLQQGRAVKTVLNQLRLLHGIFAFAERRGWAGRNPVKLVEKPRAAQGTEPDVRFLDEAELEALLAAVPDDRLGATERAIYLAAALSGLRRGELLALRWRDVDWQAGLIRVRRSYTRGQFGPPKSRRGSRAVPLAARLAAELERHYRRSQFRADEDLVFCHPQLGSVYDPAKLRKRFCAAVERAGLRPVRFHDLRHTFGTRMAAAGAPLRALQEWLGHRDYKTTSIYADYAPDASNGRLWAEKAFGNGWPSEKGEEAAGRQAEFGSSMPVSTPAESLSGADRQAESAEAASEAAGGEGERAA